MKVAIFIDGKNFYSGCKREAPGTRIDFPAMARWLVEQVGGERLWGAYYYTGIERGDRAGSDGQQALKAFLDMVELQPGFFVHRFPRKAASYRCQHCGEQNSFTQEKEVDTTMVADMLRLAAVGAFDVMVLLSGDADLAPAVEGVRSLGQQAYVGTWGRAGLSPRLRKAAFDHIDLVRGLERFGGTGGAAPEDEPRPASAPPRAKTEPEPEPPSRAVPPKVSGGEQLLAELRRAERRFQGGFVGLSYFLNRWESPVLDPSPVVRGRIVSQLEETGRVEIYEASNGDRALRCKD
ncbi:MAG: NYN domain-containing protein [Pseudomonadota bacterium]